MKNTISISLLSLLGVQVSAAESPNIIVFLVDDMGVMDSSLPFLVDKDGDVQRHPLNDWYNTPNMEKLAAQGVRFSTFYAQSVSSPSRTSIMTGQNSTRHHVTNYIKPESDNGGEYGPKDWNWEGLTSQNMTLPLMLQKSGYKTIHVGKAHFGSMGSVGENPKNLGFDVNIAGSANGQPGSYYGSWGYGNIKGFKPRAVQGLEHYYDEDMFLTEALTLEANRQIDKAVEEKRPFFLYMAHYAVHAPFDADPRFIDNYRGKGKSDNAAAFAALVEGMDKSLGDIVSHVTELGIGDNTFIIFLGDNGSDAPLGSEKGYSSSAPLRGKKGTEYEGGVRVPFIASWVKQDDKSENQQKLPIKPNSIHSKLGTVADIYPTLLNLADVEFDKNTIIDGYDLKPQLIGEKKIKRAEKVLMHFPHDHRGKYFTTYRSGVWKVIYHYNPTEPLKPTYELYNLENDPYEVENLALQEPKQLHRVVKEMSKQLENENAQYPEDKSGNILKPIIL